MNNTVIAFLVFLIAVIGHEAAHAFTAIANGYKLKKFYFGIPFEVTIGGYKITTNIYKRQIGNVEFGISLLLLGGAVDFYEFEKAPYWKFVSVVIAGPLYNLVSGFIPLLFFYDLQTSWEISKTIVVIVLEALGEFVTGGLAMAQVAGPVGAIHAMSDFGATYSNGWILLWVVLNLAFFITNILPIPAIDGGHIFTATLVAIFGERLRKPLEKVTTVSFYILLAFMAIVMTKDLW